MSVKKTILMLAMVTAVTGSAHAAAPGGQGKITFQGAIVDAPCSIDAGSADQTVQMGQVANSALAGGGHSEAQPFSIKLKGCTIDKSKTVSVTFNGASSAAQPGALALIGAAKGAAVVLTDSSENPLNLGTASPATSLIAGDNELSFAAYLKGDPAAQGNDGVTPGNFSAVTNFVLAYQ